MICLFLHYTEGQTAPSCLCGNNQTLIFYLNISYLRKISVSTMLVDRGFLQNVLNDGQSLHTSFC